MPTTCSLIVVNYKSAPLSIEAIRTARAATRNPLQVVAVDNSVDPAEAEALREHVDALIAAGSNLGYAAAINRARRSCDGEFLLICNADVRYAPQSIDNLLAVQADVAGPALFWDDAFTWILPPSDLQTAWQMLDRVAASRFPAWQAGRDRRRIRSRLAFWSLDRPTEVSSLSGAVMAIRRRIFDRHGGFDERFHLYFEENDFLRRVGGGILYVPAAHCRHIYNQSAGGSSEAVAAYGRSELRYLTKWNGELFARSAKQLERPRRFGSFPTLDGAVIPLTHEDALIEASPLPSFDTAAGHVAQGDPVAIPAEVWASYRSDRLYLRVIERHSATVVAMYERAKIPG
jgi:N-acetylglucosaminyl-diphospho-decaprenol L-rhamnosyltransferase